MKTFIICLAAVLMSLSYNLKAESFAINPNPAGNFDFDKYIKEIYNIYTSDEVHIKKERMAYKKLNDLMNQSYTFKITCSDSIAYDKKGDMTTIKSKEIYFSDNRNGYFGIIVIVTQKGDELLMKSAPDQEISVSGTINDILVTLYTKGGLYPKCRTSLKDFDDTGAEVQQIILMVQS